MDYFQRLLRRIGGWGGILGAVCILFIMVIITVNVITRSFDLPILGVYELAELFLIPVGAFTLAYAVIYKSQIEITILTSRLPKRIQAIFQIFASLVSTGIWALILLQSVNLIFERGLKEKTQLLKLIYLPFRWIWVLGIFLMCLALLVSTFNHRKEINK
jgi:TRAP-type C4-dicarboxylate transport system permease small subunit